MNWGSDQTWDTPEIEAQGFRNEIKLLQKLKGNPRIVTLYDSEEREEENGSKRILYMVMEHGEKDLSRSGHLLNCFCFPFEKRVPSSAISLCFFPLKPTFRGPKLVILQQ